MKILLNLVFALCAGLRGGSPPGYDDSAGGYYRCEIGNSCLDRWLGLAM